MDLILETAHGQGVLGLVNGGTVITEKHVDRDAVATELAQLAHDVTRIIVGVGPGSYTGVRVGMSLAQGLHLATGVPLFGVCSLCAYVPENDGPFASVVSAGPGGFYVLEGEKRGAAIEWGEPQQLKTPPEHPLVGPDYGTEASVLALSRAPVQKGVPRAIYLRAGVRSA